MRKIIVLSMISLGKVMQIPGGVIIVSYKRAGKLRQELSKLKRRTRIE
jgi:hypothetical protein